MLKMKPVEPGSLSARTYENLREALIAGSFRPGERLLMQDLAERLGTSVTPVREACFRLVSEQALELRSGRFITVPELTRSRYLQIRLIRMALEGLAAELAVDNATDADIERLVKTHRRFVKCETSHDADGARMANREFHFGVYRLSGMDMLTAQIESLWVSMGPILNVYYLQPDNEYIGAEEHLNLLKALRRRDKRAARRAIEQDIARGGENILRYFKGLEAAQSDAAEPVRRKRRSA
jgi:DNA-binding GntR family transcriptional regulator